MTQSATSEIGDDRGPGRLRTAAWQALVLVVLCLAAFRADLPRIALLPRIDLESAHGLAAPLLVLILLALRGKVIARDLRRGSIWGFFVILGALLLAFAARWPFNYYYPRLLMLPVALGGVALAVGGWRVLWRCLPMVLVLLLAMPTGERLYTALTSRPAVVTIEAVVAVLDAVPGLMAHRDRFEIICSHGGSDFIIGLGEFNLGASLLLASLTIWVFATFARVRPAWQVVATGIVAGPVALLVGFLRLMGWSLLVVYGGFGPLSGTPRLAAAVGSVVLAYLCFAVWQWVLSQLVRPVPEAEGSAGRGVPAAPRAPKRARPFFSPVFVICGLLLLAAAIGVPPAAAYLTDRYTKLPIELRQPFSTFDASDLASFRWRPDVDPGSIESDELGTADWLMETFTLVDGPDVLGGERKVVLFVSYYSDPRDTVPHTPEVCYTLGGAEVRSITPTTFRIPTPDGKTSEVTAKLLDIQTTEARQALVYFFYSNGRYYTDREQVRFALGWPGDKYTYFSKVEAFTVCLDDDLETAAEHCRQLIRESMPILLRDHFPRPEDLKRDRPKSPDAADES
ncbi:MAG: exosortase-associated EpsI family protein [Planctomycetota bacterium]|nr:exosortase-associated EpsI family protein [Planctomycetota bacterium]